LGDGDPGASRPGRKRRPTGSQRRSKTTGSHKAVGLDDDMASKRLFKAGVTFLSGGQPDKALKAFRQAHEADPDDVTFLAHYAWSLYLVDRRNAKEVVGILKKEIADHDGAELEWPALFMGHILSAEGQEDKAVRYYEECLSSNPRNVEAKRRLRLYDMRKKTSNSFLDKLFSKGKTKAAKPKATKKSKGR